MKLGSVKQCARARRNRPNQINYASVDTQYKGHRPDVIDIQNCRRQSNYN